MWVFDYRGRRYVCVMGMYENVWMRDRLCVRGVCMYVCMYECIYV